MLYVNSINGKLVVSEIENKECNKMLLYNPYAKTSMIAIRNVNIERSKGGQYYVFPTHINPQKVKPAVKAEYALSKWQVIEKLEDAIEISNKTVKRINHRYPLNDSDNFLCRIIKNILNDMDGLEVPTKYYSEVSRTTEQLRKATSNVSIAKCMDFLNLLAEFTDIKYEFSVHALDKEYKYKN